MSIERHMLRRAALKARKNPAPATDVPSGVWPTRVPAVLPGPGVGEPPRAEFSQLYKYTQHRYADDLCAKGVVKVGTLDEFRRYEDAVRGDAEDAIHFFSEPLEGRARNLSPFARQILPQLMDERIIAGATFIDSEVIGIGVHPDAYAYCCSAAYADTAAGMGDDACVAITNPQRFFEELDAGLRAYCRTTFALRSVWPARWGSVAYGPVGSPSYAMGTVDIAYRKALRFQREAEVRVLWPGGYKPPEPFAILTIPSLRAFVERIDFPS